MRPLPRSEIQSGPPLTWQIGDVKVTRIVEMETVAGYLVIPRTYTKCAEHFGQKCHGGCGNPAHDQMREWHTRAAQAPRSLEGQVLHPDAAGSHPYRDQIFRPDPPSFLVQFCVYVKITPWPVLAANAVLGSFVGLVLGAGLYTALTHLWVALTLLFLVLIGWAFHTTMAHLIRRHKQ